MALTAVERLTTEYENLNKERKYLFFANPIIVHNKLNLFRWDCSFPGPNVKLYGDSYYNVSIIFTKEYPYKPPKVIFKEYVFHPNVYLDGRVCLDILNEKWKSGFGVMKILTALQTLLMQPNGNSPANGDASSLLSFKKNMYEKKVRENIMNYHNIPEYLKR